MWFSIDEVLPLLDNSLIRLYHTHFVYFNFKLCSTCLCVHLIHLTIIFPDDIRLHGFVGHFTEGNLLPHTHSVQLFTHLYFHIAYNGQKVGTDFS